MFNNAAITALGAALESETVLHLADMSDTTNPVLNVALNNLIRGLKEDAIWNKLEAICVIHDNAADSLLDLKRLTNSINNGAPFTAGAGFAKNGIAGYVSLNNVAVFGSTTHANGDFHWMSYRSDVVDAALFDMGVGNTLASPNQSCIIQGAKTTGCLMDSQYVEAVTTPNGLATDRFFIGSNTSNTTCFTQLGNTVLPYTGLTTSRDVPLGDVNSDIFITNYSSAGSPLNPNDQGERFAGWSFGVALSVPEAANLKTRLDTFMAAIGV